MTSQQNKLPRLKAFSDRIRYVREKADLTLQELGTMCRVSRSYLSRLENGSRTNPSAGFLDVCSAMLGLDREWLRTGVGQPPQQVKAQTQSGLPAHWKDGPIAIQGYKPEQYGVRDEAVTEAELSAMRANIQHLIRAKDAPNLCEEILNTLKHGGTYRTRVIFATALAEETLNQLQGINSRERPMDYLEIRSCEHRPRGANDYEWRVFVLNYKSNPVAAALRVNLLDVKGRVLAEARASVELGPKQGKMFEGAITLASSKMKRVRDLTLEWIVPAIGWGR